MEILFEILLELIFDGMCEATKSKKVPIPIRIISAVFIALLFLAVVLLIAFVGIIAVKSNVLFGIFIFIIDAVIVAAIIRKIIIFKT